MEEFLIFGTRDLHPLCQSGLHYILRDELAVHPLEWARTCALTNSATAEWALSLAQFFLGG